MYSCGIVSPLNSLPNKTKRAGKSKVAFTRPGQWKQYFRTFFLIGQGRNSQS
jgi:hypothetical protein